MDRENYFILLDIDPRIRDTKIIADAIKAFKIKATKKSAHPNAVTKAEGMAEMKMAKDIEVLMNDRTKIEEEAKAAIIKKKALLENTRKELEKRIQYLVNKNTIGKKVLENLLKKEFKSVDVLLFKTWFPKINITEEKKVETNYNDPYKGIKLIANYNQIVKQLNVNGINKKDLYDFLDAPSRGKTSIKELQRKADEKYKYYNEKADKNDQSVSIGQKLAGECKTIFKNEDGIDRYEASIANYEYKGLLEIVDLKCSETKIIDDQTFNKLLKYASDHSLKKEAALFKIQAYCQKKKFVFTPLSDTQQAQKSCNFCHHYPIKKTDRYCPSCANPTVVDCPKCNTNQDTSNKNCTKCGFAIGDMPEALALIKQAKQYLNNDWQKVKTLSENALDYWPKNKEAIDLQNKADQKAKESIQQIQSLNNLIYERKLYTAKSKLNAIVNYEQNVNLKKIDLTITKKIKQIDQLIVKAGNTKNNDQKLVFFLQAIAIAKDCKIAIDALDKIPPSAPKNLTVTSVNGGFKLNWKVPKNTKGVEYAVIQSINKIPNTYLDGKELDLVSTNAFMAYPKTENGNICYYAIFSKRGKTYSTQAAISKGDVLITPLQDLSTKPAENSIVVNWKAIGRFKAIDIVRVDGNKKTKITTFKKGGFTDNNLITGKNYQYEIKVLYENADCKIITGPVKTISVTPQAPPKPVINFNYKIANKVLYFTWENSSKQAQTVVYQSNNLFNFNKGTIFNINQLSQYGKPLQNQSNESGQSPLDFQGVNYFIPFCILADNAVCGKVIAITNIDEVENVNKQKGSSFLKLTWDWPPIIKQVKVSWAFGNFPANDQNSRIISLSEYQQYNGFEFKNPLDKTYYFLIKTISNDGNSKPIESKGKEIIVTAGKAKRIKYEIKKSFLSGKRVIIESDNGIPNMILIAKKGKRAPFNRTDGEVILNVDKKENGAGRVEKKIPKNYVNKNYSVRLFLKESTEAEMYRIVSTSESLNI